jgi:hypothetical protein
MNTLCPLALDAILAINVVKNSTPCFILRQSANILTRVPTDTHRDSEILNLRNQHFLKTFYLPFLSLQLFSQFPARLVGKANRIGLLTAKNYMSFNVSFPINLLVRQLVKVESHGRTYIGKLDSTTFRDVQ